MVEEELRDWMGGGDTIAPTRGAAWCAGKSLTRRSGAIEGRRTRSGSTGE